MLSLINKLSRNKRKFRDRSPMHFIPFRQCRYFYCWDFFLYCQMNREPSTGSRSVGFRCTNKSCLRIFNFRNALLRHKTHKSQKETICADPKMAERMYEINDNRSSSLQSSRIVTLPLSGSSSLPTFTKYAP